MALIFAQSGPTQRPPQEVQRAPAKPTPVSGSKADLEADTVAQSRKRAVLHVHDFVDRVFDFRDEKAKIRTLVTLADLLWKDDEPYARQLFLKAFDLLKALTLSAAKGATASAESKQTTMDLAYLRQEIITRIARRDAALARRLADADTTSDSPDTDAAAGVETHLGIALNLVKDKPAEAVESAEQSLQGGVSRGMISLLNELRRNDEAAANALFLKTLDRLIAQPVVDANDLLRIGTYLFTSPLADLSPGAFQMVIVDKILVYNVSAERPDIPPEIVRAYLNTAITILTRPVSDPKQKQLYYAAGYQLLPKAQQFIPDRAPQLAAAMQALIPEISPALTQEATYTNLKSTSRVTNVEEALGEIDKISDERSRDARYLSLIFTLWDQGEFIRARTVAAKVKDPTARVRLVTLIDFGEAAKSLDRGETTLAEEIAGKLSPGIERAVLWLGIVRACAEKGDAQRTSEAANAALKEARRVADGRRPFLILATAGQLARFDPIGALQALSEAVQAFNAEEVKSLAQVQWSQMIEAGKLRRNFSLKVKGIEYGFDQALLPLVTADFDGTLAIVSDLKDERVLAPGLIALAAALLK